RDSWGVPHVYADTPRALAFAFGYAQAEDRLETVMRAYRMSMPIPRARWHLRSGMPRRRTVLRR
ncbi:MAG: penicillin acylase family protein, partial [Candidatus Hydrogenedentota bacterium]